MIRANARSRMSRSWCRVNDMEHPEEVPLCVKNAETALLDESERLPVPDAAETPSVPACTAVLEASERSGVASPVL